MGAMSQHLLPLNSEESLLLTSEVILWKWRCPFRGKPQVEKDGLTLHMGTSGNTCPNLLASGMAHCAMATELQRSGPGCKQLDNTTTNHQAVYSIFYHSSSSHIHCL